MLRPIGVLALSVLCLWGCGSSNNGIDIVFTPPFEDPPFISSSNGELSLTLESAESQITVAGNTVTARVFNGVYIPPVFRLQQGDTLKV